MMGGVFYPTESESIGKVNPVYLGKVSYEKGPISTKLDLWKRQNTNLWSNGLMRS